MKSILSVRELKKVYPGKPPFVAVDGISFDLGDGEILGLLGLNGAGKTTTIQMLLSTLTYTSGSIHYFDLDLKKKRQEIMSQVAFASSYVSLPSLLTIEQNLSIFGRLYGLSGKEIRERADPLLERFGLLEKKKNRTGAMSSGQATRLMLIKAFLVRPKVVLLDEPTASLDPDAAQDVLSFLREERENRGMSIVFTSHRMNEVSELCDRVIFLQKGKIIADDKPYKLAESSSNYRLCLQVEQCVAQLEALARSLNYPFQIKDRIVEISLNKHQIPSFLNSLGQEGISYTGIRIHEPKLDDYFLKMSEL